MLKADGHRCVKEIESLSGAGDVDMPISGCDDAHGLQGTRLPDAALRRWRFAQMQTAWGRSHACRVALTEAGAVLASATRYRLSGILNGDRIRVCALGDVTSAADGNPELTRTLVEDVIADATDRHGAEVALLFRCDIHDWHGEAGFQDITPPSVELAFPPARRPGAPMVSVRAGENRDLPAMVAMGQSWSTSFRFHLDRDVDFVLHTIVRERLLAGLGTSGAQELQFFVTEEGTVATAYVVLRVCGDVWTVLQCGDRDPSGARVGAIIQALIAREPARSSPVVRGWFPTGFTPPQANRVSVSPSPPTLWARLLGSRQYESPLTADSSFYWISDRL